MGVGTRNGRAGDGSHLKAIFGAAVGAFVATVVAAVGVVLFAGAAGAAVVLILGGVVGLVVGQPVLIAEAAVGGTAQVLRAKLAPVGVTVLVFAAVLVVVAVLGAVAEITAVGALRHQAGGVGFLIFLGLVVGIHSSFCHAGFGIGQRFARYRGGRVVGSRRG